jgi:hypothetical protein
MEALCWLQAPQCIDYQRTVPYSHLWWASWWVGRCKLVLLNWSQFWIGSDKNESWGGIQDCIWNPLWTFWIQGDMFWHVWSPRYLPRCNIMNTTLHPLLTRCVIVFFDDTLVYSSSYEEHILHLRAVFELLALDQWQVNFLNAPLHSGKFLIWVILSVERECLQIIVNRSYH